MKLQEVDNTRKMTKDGLLDVIWPLSHANLQSTSSAWAANEKNSEKSPIFQKERIYKGSECLWSKHVVQLHFQYHRRVAYMYIPTLSYMY